MSALVITRSSRPGLDRVAHLDALVGQRDLLELGQPLDVALEHVAAGARAARPRCRRRPPSSTASIVSGSTFSWPHSAALMTCGDSLYLVSTCSDELGMAALLLVRQRLADVVQQAHALGELDVGP